MNINKLTARFEGSRKVWATYVLSGNGVIAWYASINPDSPLITWLHANVGVAGAIVSGLVGFLMVALIDEQEWPEIEDAKPAESKPASARETLDSLDDLR